jgi:hypothetical protein
MLIAFLDRYSSQVRLFVEGFIEVALQGESKTPDPSQLAFG